MLYFFLSSVLLSTSVFLIWTYYGRGLPLEPPWLNVGEVKAFGEDRQKGNVVSVQPWMLPQDYASEQAFAQKMDGYLQEAQKQGWLNPKTLVVFPEYIGTWLVVMHEKAEVYSQSTLNQAMLWMVSSNIYGLLTRSAALPKRIQSPNDQMAYGLFAFKASQMAATYHRVFGGLAKKYGVSIVAGSILLSNPSLKQDELVAGNGELYNVSVVYLPTGKPYPQLIKKAYPIAEEKTFVAAGAPQDIPILDLPIGKTGVLICADSWYAQCYAPLAKDSVQVLVVPSFVSGQQAWSKPWKGYSGQPNPSEVDKQDIQKLTEGEAWQKYALAGRLAQTSIPLGVNVFLRGLLWDLGSDGATTFYQEGQTWQATHQSKAALHCIWVK